jgi:hypothetical protein
MASVEYTFQVILRKSRALGWLAAAVALIVCAAPAWADTVDYEIEVELQAASHRLQSKEKVRWTNSTDTPTSDVYLHLYLNAFSSSQTTFMRELGWSSLRNRVEATGDWGWTRIDRLVTSEGDDLLPAVEFVRPDDGNPGDFTVVRIPLPREVPPGSSVELEMDFEAQLPWIIARTGYVGDFHLLGQWFPKLGVFEGADGWNCHQFHASSEFFADFGSYRVAMTIPEDWVLGATGIEVSSTPVDGGRRTVVFRAERVHDFAWCTAPPDLMEVVETDFEPGRDVPPSWLARARARLGLSAAELELPPMHIRLLVPVVQHRLVPRMVRAARLSVAWFGLHYGVYPYPQLTVVSPPRGAEEAGGMEYATLITTGADRLDEFPPFSWSADIEVVTVHEFGHQYFQGMLASNEFEEAWLDEGVNSYAEIACMSDIVEDRLVPEIRAYSPWAGERLELGIQTVPLTIAANAWDFRNQWMYFQASYGKTAVVLRTAEGLIGADAMARGLRAYVERFSFQHPTGHDLVATLGEAGGVDLAKFFAQAIYSDATPDWGVLDVRHRRPKTVDGFVWDGAGWRESESSDEPVSDDGGEDEAGPWQIEVDLVRRGDFIGPVDVELTWDDGAIERRRWDGDERWVRWRFDGDRRLEQVVVDPDGVWALEILRADNYWRDSPARTEPPLWWVREIAGLMGRIFLRFS